MPTILQEPLDLGEWRGAHQFAGFRRRSFFQGRFKVRVADDSTLGVAQGPGSAFSLTSQMVVRAAAVRRTSSAASLRADLPWLPLVVLPAPK